jgi:aspartate kinase
MTKPKVFKFGGASVKDASAVRNVAGILQRYQHQPLVVVVSAMGKTTNALEELVRTHASGGQWQNVWQERKDFHHAIMQDLFAPGDAAFDAVEHSFGQLADWLREPASENYDFNYDQVVSWGEVISTQIVHHFLANEGLDSHWLDARKLIRTDSNWREGRINWEKTQQLVAAATPFLSSGGIGVIQGFLGHTPERFVTTLGREGSDFTAAILAWCLDAESVTIWKDVPGVLNADPKWFDNTVKLDTISFHEAIELTYYGATIIHPRTIKPLENKDIPLYVRSFVQPDAPGTRISHDSSGDGVVPSFIFKVNQVLISITPRDFSFVMEDHLSDIFSAFSAHSVRIHLMQNSAINFSVCVDWDDRRIPALLEDLQKNYLVKYNTGMELVTIRHFDDATIARVTEGKEVLVNQRTRVTARMVMRDVSPVQG